MGASRDGGDSSGGSSRPRSETRCEWDDIRRHADRYGSRRSCRRLGPPRWSCPWSGPEGRRYWCRLRPSCVCPDDLHPDPVRDRDCTGGSWSEEDWSPCRRDARRGPETNDDGRWLARPSCDPSGRALGLCPERTYSRAPNPSVSRDGWDHRWSSVGTRRSIRPRSARGGLPGVEIFSPSDFGREHWLLSTPLRHCTPFRDKRLSDEGSRLRVGG